MEIDLDLSKPIYMAMSRWHFHDSGEKVLSISNFCPKKFSIPDYETICYAVLWNKDKDSADLSWKGRQQCWSSRR